MTLTEALAEADVARGCDPEKVRDTSRALIVLADEVLRLRRTETDVQVVTLEDVHFEPGCKLCGATSHISTTIPLGRFTAEVCPNVQKPCREFYDLNREVWADHLTWNEIQRQVIDGLEPSEGMPRLNH